MPGPFSEEAHWESKKHDKALLRAYSDYGYKQFVSSFNEARRLASAEKSQLVEGAAIEISQEVAMARIERLCTFFRDVATLSKGADKAKMMNMQAQ